jgi:hypothetical protein
VNEAKGFVEANKAAGLTHSCPFGRKSAVRVELFGKTRNGVCVRYLAYTFTVFLCALFCMVRLFVNLFDKKAEFPKAVLSANFC